MQRIREAERKAEEEVKAAQAEALRIGEEAQGKAMALIEGARRGAEEAKRKATEEGKEQGETEAQGLRERGAKERRELRLRAESRLDKAVKLLLERVFG